MRILFVVPTLFYSEPMGVMQLSAICKAAGHQTKLASLQKHDLRAMLDEFRPDIVGYSVMSPDYIRFEHADRAVRSWSRKSGHKVVRVMGGPHPTFFPAVLQQLELDAICIGEGDESILPIIRAVEQGLPLNGIPNVATLEQPEPTKALVPDLDDLPFLDRDILYEADPELLQSGLRSFQTMRGCPHKCTYCFNHAYNLMFKGEGRKIIRRRSVDNLLQEVKDVVRRYPDVRLIRFSDDVFGLRVDEWLEEFAERYPKEVGIPFYALQRANSLTEDMARLLNKAGCRSLCMSIESGVEELRNKVLKRNMPDSLMIEAFNISKKYNIKIIASTILGIPGTTIEDDYNSFLFVRKVRPEAPQFVIFCPYPGTDLTEYANDLGVLSGTFDYSSSVYVAKSLLEQYTAEEKEVQLRLMYLAPIFVFVPNFMMPLLKPLMKLPLTEFYRVVGHLFSSYIWGTRIYKGAAPKGIRNYMMAAIRAFTYMGARDRVDHLVDDEA